MAPSTSSSVRIQQQASNPDANVYLAASAGTGKTKTLVDRMLRLLLNGVKVEDILCITFTNAAANEMLERLKSRLEKWFIMSEEQLRFEVEELVGKKLASDKLRHAKQLYLIYLDNFDKFRIQTLHSFCVQILSQMHYIDENELDKIKIIDSYAKKKLIEDAYEKVTNLSLTKVEIDFAINKLAQKYDYDGISQLTSNLLSQKQKLYTFFNASNSIAELIDDQYKFYGASKNISSCSIIDGFINEDLDDITGHFSGFHWEGEEALLIIKSWASGDAKFKKENLGKYLDCFLTKSMEPRVRLPFSKRFKDANLGFIELYKVEQQRIINYLEAKTSQEQAEFMQYVIIFVNQITNEYEKLKDELGYLEYDDLILKVSEIFNSNNDMETLLFSLNLSLSHILIDEAQDLSKNQWLLMRKVIDGMAHVGKTIFIVGDYKQSIYGFQGAEPEYFLEINELYKAKLISWQSLELTHSFRSQKEILEAVDRIFNSIRFTHNLNHIAVKDGVGKVQVIEHSYQEPERIKEVGWALPQKEKSVSEKRQHNSEELADFVEHLLSRGDVKPNDIMVLFRKRGERIGYFIEALKEKNISVSQTDKLEFAENLLILDLLSVIKFCLLPEDDLNLACLLKSSFFHFTEEELFKISYKRGEESIWDVLQKFEVDVSQFLLKLREEYKGSSIYQFYTNLLYRHKFIMKLRDEFGVASQEIVDLFLDKVLEFEAKHQSGGQSFLEWIKDNSYIAIKNDHIDGVKVITAHSAKGLQSPIVIIADASDSENSPADPYCWYNDRLIIQYSNKYEINMIAKIKQERNAKVKQESLRLLYVAMTRAENELYIFGDAKSKEDSWYSIARNILSEHFIKYAQTTRDKPAIALNPKEENDDSIILPDFLTEGYVSQKIERNFQIASEEAQIYSDLSVTRGNFIHKILSDIAKISEQDIERYVKCIANTENFKILSDKEVDEIIGITKSIIQKFPDVFYGDNVVSEMSLKSDVEGGAISAKIDKLIINENSICIIEIKADKSKQITIDSIPYEYKRQLEIYKKCISLVYPNKNITCKLLSFYQRKLLELN